MMRSKTNNIIKKLGECLSQKYQKSIESQKISYPIFHCADQLYYKLHKTSLKRAGSSYIYSPRWLKNKKATINPRNNDNNCFQYAITNALNHQNVKKDPQRILQIKPFIDHYEWKGIKFPPKPIEDCKKFESNNKSIALNVLYIPHNTEKIKLAFKSKYNYGRESQVVLFMITAGKKQHYLALKCGPSDDKKWCKLSEKKLVKIIQRNKIK